MLDQELQKAIYRFNEEGLSIRQISRTLHISRNTVRRVISSKGSMPIRFRSNQFDINQELVQKLFKRCSGKSQRIYEILNEEYGIKIGYSTVARIVQESGLRISKNKRFEDGQKYSEPGSEIQHDTSPYRVKIGGTTVRVTASLLYFRYSKQRYLKFYRSFDRFRMKTFFYEALTHFGFTCSKCVIDNTNLAVLRGTGGNAVFVPEMVHFAKRFGFEWLAHEQGHSNRKAGEERSFWFVETNFLPGREFSSLEDLNAQALQWATVRTASRAQTKARIVPNEYFEREKDFLIKLPAYVPEPYAEHKRTIDRYGNISFDANAYWVPGNKRGDVKVLEYRNRIEIYEKREKKIEYQLPLSGVRGEKFKPDGVPSTPYVPRAIQAMRFVEEQKLLSEIPEITEYLQFALKKHPRPSSRSKFLKGLYLLSQKVSGEFFLKSIDRAFKYGIFSLLSVERICQQMLTNALMDAPLEFDIPELNDREIYLEGRMSYPPDLDAYKPQEESEEQNG